MEPLHFRNFTRHSNLSCQYTESAPGKILDPLILLNGKYLTELMRSAVGRLVTIAPHQNTSVLANANSTPSKGSLQPAFASDTTLTTLQEQSNNNFADLLGSNNSFVDSLQADVNRIQAYPLEALGEFWQLFLIFLYSFTAIMSILFNVVAVTVLLSCRKSKLRKYLLNLSMSDLLMSLLSIRE